MAVYTNVVGCTTSITDSMVDGIRESTNTTKRREAELILDRFKQKIKEAKRPEIKNAVNEYKLAELAQEYLKWTERQRVHKTKKIWVKQLVEVFGNL